MTKANGAITASGFMLQDQPAIAVMGIPGNWLLQHSTPSWRMDDPEKGFQRVVKEARAKQIAVAVLDQGRTFPNAVVLATDKKLPVDDGTFNLANNLRFLVVDGQHRLWAQRFSEYEALYACIVHTGLTEVDMAKLFLEINDNQKRVPASLRWDLVRLVQPDDDQKALQAAELVYQLATDRESPLYQRIDLTGEQAEIKLKQGSIAPELKTLVSSKRAVAHELAYDDYFDALSRYLAAIKSADPDGWTSGDSPFMSARVLRALLRLSLDIAEAEGKALHQIPAKKYFEYVAKIDRKGLSPDKIRAMQAAAGVKEIHDLLKKQIGVA